MQHRKQLATLLVAALTLAACAVPPYLRGHVGAVASPSTSPPAATSGPAPSGSSGPVATATAAAAASNAATAVASEPTAAPTAQASAAGQGSAVSDAVRQAVQAVIQKANDEQQQAFDKKDPTVMRDTATSSYYQEMVQVNRDLADGGVTGIKLLKLEWGSIVQQPAGTVEATTFETWRTTYSDGSTDDSRDRNVYTLVQEQNAWKIQADAHPDDQLDQQPGPTIPGIGVPGVGVPGVGVPGTGNPGRGSQPPSGGNPGQSPQPPTGVVPARTGQSHNWSGYAATGGTYTAVSGTWTVPQTTSDGSFGSEATWVGIGGVRSRDLIQAGTETTASNSGRVRYQAWIELLPRASHPVTLTVNPGDSVTVSISQQSGDQWAIAMKNNTTGQEYDTTVTYQSSLSSAEWVEEAPSGGRRVLPLDNFGSIQFTGGSATKDGKTVTIAGAGARPITMIDASGQPIATPSSLGADGSSFTVTQQTPPSNPAAGQQGSGQPGAGQSPLGPGRRIPRGIPDPLQVPFGPLS